MTSVRSTLSPPLANAFARAKDTDCLQAHAFTLIELLIVIAILAVLIGALAPSLAGARRTARSGVCQSNVRQLILALDTYANDHADRFAPGGAGRLANLHRWHGSRAAPGQAFSPAGGSLTDYLSAPNDPRHAASRMLRSCPEFAATAARLAQRNTGFERSAGGYGYNNAFVGTDRVAVGPDPATGATVFAIRTDELGSQRHRFKTPSRTIAFADAAFADGNPVAGVIEYSFVEPRFWPENPGQRADPSTHFRHAPGLRGVPRASIGALDGHVASEVSTFSWSSGFFPANPKDLNIGWSGASDDNTLFEY